MSVLQTLLWADLLRAVIDVLSNAEGRLTTEQVQQALPEEFRTLHRRRLVAALQQLRNESLIESSLARTADDFSRAWRWNGFDLDSFLAGAAA